MTSEEKVEQRIRIKFCVELGKTPMETKKLLETTSKGSGVSRALVYRWHKRYSEGRSTPYDDVKPGRPSVIDENVTSTVQNAIRKDGRSTVRDIALLCDIGVATAHKILTEKLNLVRLCARWVPRLLTLEDQNRRVAASRAFPCVKAELRGLKFRDFSELKTATLNAVRKLDVQWCRNVFDKWVQRHMKCIEKEGVYFEKE